MRAYFIRRFLLVIPTMLGITLLVFCVTRFAPGGPMDTVLQTAVAGESGKSSSGQTKSSSPLSNDSIERL